MSFHDQMTAAVDGARTLNQIDHLSRLIWQGLAAGAVGDDDAQLLAEHLHARRALLRGEIKPVDRPPGKPSIFPPRRPQKAPRRAVSIARRRTLAASGPLPPALAARFTTGELAVLRIVGDEVRLRGHCDRCLDEVAARAGVCRRLAQGAIREAARLGLVTIEERRREGKRNLANVVRVIAKEWVLWIAKGARPARPQAATLTGCKNLHPTGNQERKAAGKAAAGAGARESQGARVGRPPWSGRLDSRRR